MTTLALDPTEMACLVGLGADETTDLGWTVAIPTYEAVRQAVRTGGPTFIEKNFSRAAQVALAPLRPLAEARLVNNLADQRADVLAERMMWGDPELRPMALADRDAAEAGFKALASEQGELLGEVGASGAGKPQRW